MFCPKCKSVLKPQKDYGKTVFKCANCGITIESEGRHTIKETKKKPVEKGEGVAEEKNILAVYAHKCEKCGYGKAELIEKGVWYTDEDHVVLYRCGRCGHVEREDAKIK